jgi:hypothetical protein
MFLFATAEVTKLRHVLQEMLCQASQDRAAEPREETSLLRRSVSVRCRAEAIIKYAPSTLLACVFYSREVYCPPSPSAPLTEGLLIGHSVTNS